MAVGGEVIYIIKADDKQFNQALNTADKKAGSTSKSMASAFQKIQGVLLATGVTLLAKKVIDLGIAAEETGSKFRTVFSGVLDKANDQIKELTTNYGLSTLAAQTLLSGTGDLLTGFGFTQEKALELSTATAKLGADLASFSNYAGGAKGATEALTKALLGERESVKALGISIMEEDVQKQIAINRSQGMTFETEREEKAVATLTIAYNQSKNAIGDFQRTQDSAANRIRVLQNRLEDLGVNVGKQLLPVVGEIVGKLITALPQVEKAIQPLIPAFIKIGQIVGEAFELIGNVLEIAQPLLDVAGKLLGIVLDIAGAPIKFVNDAIEAEKAFQGIVDKNRELLEYQTETGRKIKLSSDEARSLAQDLQWAVDNGADMDYFMENISKKTGISKENIEKYASSIGIVTDKERQLSEEKAYQEARMALVDGYYDKAKVKAAEIAEAERKVTEQKKFQAAWQNLINTYYDTSKVNAAKALEDIKATEKVLIDWFEVGEKIYDSATKDAENREKVYKLIGDTVTAEQRLKDLQADKQKIAQGIADFETQGFLATDTRLIALKEELALLKEKEPELKKIAEAEKEQTEAIEDQKKRLDDVKKGWEDLGNLIGNQVKSAFGDLFNTVGEGLAGNQDAWNNLAQTALGGLSEILNALGDQLIAQAVVSAITGNLVAAGLATAGAAGAYIAAGAISQAAANLSTPAVEAANGADFIVPPGYPNDSFPMRVESGERVTVQPATQAAGGGGSSRFVLVLDNGTQLTGYMQEQIDNGKLRIGRARA